MDVINVTGPSLQDYAQGMAIAIPIFIWLLLIWWILCNEKSFKKSFWER